MDVLDGIGAGLIAGGALLLLPTLLAPGPQIIEIARSGDALREHRRDRTARVGASVSAIATLAGATLLLVATRRWVALGAGGSVLVAGWLVLAWRLSREYAEVARSVSLFVGKPKGVPVELAAAVGLIALVPGGSELPAAVDPQRVLTIARERSSYRRALLRPFGYSDGL